MSDELHNPDEPSMGENFVDPEVERRIWLAAYLHALGSMDLDGAEAAADEAVQRYVDRWIGRSLPRIPVALRPFVEPRPEYEGLVII